MNVKQKNLMLEDRIITLAINDPGVLLSIPFDINIFTKWRDVVATMMGQQVSGIIPDIGTITNALPGLNEYAVSQLEELIWDSKATPSSYEFYVEELSKGATEIRIYDEIRKQFASISHENKPSDVIASLSCLFTSSFSDIGKKKVYDASQLTSALDERLLDMEQNKKRYQLRLGIPELDKYYQGLHPGNMIVVGARPGCGKTAFATTTSLNLARAGYKVGFISTEMQSFEVTGRYLSLFSGVPYTPLMHGEISKDSNDWIRLEDARKEFNKLNIYVYEGKVTVAQIAAQARAWMATKGLDILFIDYLTKLEMDDRKPMNERVAEAVTSIKNLAKDIKLPIVLLAQLNRKANEKRPSIAELKDSGVIEQEADSILLLSLPNKFEPDAVTGVIVGKNRHGASGMPIEINYHGETMRWY